MYIHALVATVCIGMCHAVTYPALTRQQYAEYVAQQQQTLPEHQQQLEQPTQPQTISIIPKRHYKAPPHQVQQVVEDEAIPSPAQYKQVLEQPVYYQQYQQPQAAPTQYAQPQYQAPQVPKPKYRIPAGYKAAPQGQDSQQPPEDYDPNPQYQFGFDIRDDENTNYHNRKEQREGDKITGSYSVVDSDGFIRTVTYTADPKEGFKADVSREPTDIRVKIPTPPPATPQQYKIVAASPVPTQYRKPAPVQYVERPQQEEIPSRPQYVTLAQPQYQPSSQYRLVSPQKGGTLFQQAPAYHQEQ